MDCSEARRYINQGVKPGSNHPMRASLGFHLASCPSCRAYRDQQETLLASLLVDTPPKPHTPQSATPPPTATTASHPTLRQRAAALARDPGKLLWIVSIALLIAIPLGGLARVALVLFRAHQNVSAMIVPAAPAPDDTAPPGLTPTLPPTADQRSMAGLSPLPDEADNEQGTPQPATKATAEALVAPTEPTSWPTIQSLAPSPTLETYSPRTPTPAIPPPGGAVNVLFLGTDNRPDEMGVPRTDAILLVRIEPDSGRVAMLSLPRDMWVQVPGYGATRINNAYVWGEIYQAPGGGMNLARRTVSVLLDVRVDYVVMADFQGFIHLIDTLGGITVHVEKELYDPSFPTMDYGYKTVHFLPGSQWMDGQTALEYSRVRHPDSDFMRSERQQDVMVGIARQLRERGDIQNLMTLDKLTGALRDYVRTDMPEDRILGLVWSVRHYDLANVEQYSIQSDMVTWGAGGDPYALSVPNATLAQITAKFMGWAKATE